MRDTFALDGRGSGSSVRVGCRFSGPVEVDKVGISECTILDGCGLTAGCCVEDFV